MSTITITTEKAKYPGSLADEYLALQARQAGLAEQMRDLKSRIDGTGHKVIEGNWARVTVSHTANGLTFDAAMAKTFLSEATIAKCQKVRKGATQFRCFALKVDSTLAA